MIAIPVPPSCTCEMCVNCCKASPCLGTPEDISKIANSEFADVLCSTLVYDATDNTFNETIQIHGTPYELNGHKLVRCSMLDENNRCKLHKLNLKPLEGRLIDHNCSHQQTINIRHLILKYWKGFKL